MKRSKKTKTTIFEIDQNNLSQLLLDEFALLLYLKKDTNTKGDRLHVTKLENKLQLTKR